MANVKRKYNLPEIKDPAKKVYLPLYMNNFRVVGIIDSGADITIMQQSLFDKIMPPDEGENRFLPSSINNIYSFSDHAIPVKGRVNWVVRLSPKHAGITLDIYIIPSNHNVPELLLGKDLLEAGLGTLGFRGEVQDPYPIVEFTYPTFFKCTTYHSSPADIYLCHGQYDLEPFQKDAIDICLSPSAPIIRTDWILITAIKFQNVIIIPSRSDVCWDFSKKCFIATACVVNLTNKHQTGKIEGKIEVVNDYNPVAIDDDSRPKLEYCLRNHPFGREILQSHVDYAGGRPAVTVHSMSTSAKPNIQVSDLDYADAIFASEPEYTGVATMHSDIIDPAGYELPTIIFDNATEAVQLHKLPVHIQPFIKHIFIDTYPQVVSLHGLDAGNLSLTLGYTQLRLREGELLPRAKRIFHVSPSDSRHLDDIINLLIKFGFVMRSPPRRQAIICMV